MPATPAGCLDIYVDGSCLDNGKDGARGGFGGFYGDGDGRNFALPLAAGERQTNNRGELRAIEHALQQELDHATLLGRFDVLRIHTDSMYSINCVTKLLPIWKRNGFKNSNKKPVENKDLIVSIDQLIGDYCRCKTRADGASPALPQPGVQLVHVKGHSNIYGNEMADQLALKGADMMVRKEVLAVIAPTKKSSPEVLEVAESSVCCMCARKQQATLLLPCRHALCSVCAKKASAHASDDRCPNCGEEVVLLFC